MVPPHAGHSLVNFSGNVTRQADGEIKAWAFPRFVTVGGPVVEQVYATAKSDLCIHHTELAVQTTPTPGQQHPPTLCRVKYMHLNARGRESVIPRLWKHARANAIDCHPHRHTTPCCTLQRLRDGDYATAKIKDIGLEQQLRLRHVNGVHEGRKVGLSARQQLPRRGRCRLHAATSSATRGRWSDMRAQALLRGTYKVLQCHPRV